jgi:hypothetical protein
VALSEPTPGGANAEPRIGPIVINEIMYHPDITADAEYVELLNISDAPATLYDAEAGSPWRFTDDPEDATIELLFPSEPPVTLAPGEYLLLVRDLSLFKSKYVAPTGVKSYVWNMGQLGNDGETIQISKPGGADDDGTRYWIAVDRVAYSDGSHPEDFPQGADPWPVQADGQGTSLSRIDPTAYGNDPGNWRSGTPSPGGANH